MIKANSKSFENFIKHNTITLNDFYIDDIIIQTRKSLIRRAKLKINNHYVAIKTINYNCDSTTENEIEILDFLNNTESNICYFCSIHEHDKVHIVMELADIDMLMMINDQLSNKNYVVDNYIIYFQNICNNIKFIHDKNIVHGDIKLENFLISQNKIKLSDFGHSFFVGKKRILNSGTPGYFSPENVNNKKIGFYTDVWCLGILLGQILTLDNTIYFGKKLSDYKYTINKIAKKIKIKELRNLFISMMQMNYKNRPTIDQVCETLEYFIDE